MQAQQPYPDPPNPPPLREIPPPPTPPERDGPFPKVPTQPPL